MHIEEILYKDSRIKILTDKERLVRAAYDELVKQRTLIEEFIEKNKIFESSLKPLTVPEDAPEIVKRMADAGKIAAVGPLAAVAVTIA